MTCKNFIYGMCTCRKENVSLRSETDICYAVFTSKNEKNCSGYVDKKDEKC